MSTVVNYFCVVFLYCSRPNAQGPEKGDPEATGHGAGLGHGPDLQPEEVLGRDDVKAYLKAIQVKSYIWFLGTWPLLPFPPLSLSPSPLFPLTCSLFFRNFKEKTPARFGIGFLAFSQLYVTIRVF